MVALSFLVVAICGGVYGDLDVPKEEPDTPCTLCTVPLCRVYPRNDNISSDLTVNFNNLSLIFQRTEHKSRMNKLFNEDCKMRLVDCRTTKRRSPKRVENNSMIRLFFYDYLRTQTCLFFTSNKQLKCTPWIQGGHIRAIDPYNGNVYFTHKHKTVAIGNDGKVKYSMNGAAHDVILSPGEDVLVYSNVRSGLFMSKKNFKDEFKLMDTAFRTNAILAGNINDIKGEYAFLMMDEGKCKMNIMNLKLKDHLIDMATPKHFCKRKGSLYKVDTTLFKCEKKLSVYDLFTMKESTIQESKCSSCAVHGLTILCSFDCGLGNLCPYIMTYNSEDYKLDNISLPHELVYSRFIGIVL